MWKLGCLASGRDQAVIAMLRIEGFEGVGVGGEVGLKCCVDRGLESREILPVGPADPMFNIMFDI